MRRIFAFMAFLCCVCSYAANNDALLDELDVLIAKRWELRQPIYQRIDSLKLLESNMTNADRVGLYMQLYDCYSHLKADSALYYADRLIRLPETRQNPDSEVTSLLNRAEALALMGAFSDAERIVNGLENKQMKHELRLRYYHIRRTIYGWLADYLRDTPSLALDVKKKTDAYRDSIIAYETDEVSRAIVIADKWLSNGYPEKAGEEITKYLDGQVEPRYRSYMYYIMAEACRLRQQRDMQMRYLILCSIEDFKRGVTEYTALPNLVKLLHEDGDVERSHDYLLCSLEDATYCRSHLRSIEMADAMPIIIKAHESDDMNREKAYIMVSICIGMLTIILLATVFYLYKERNKVARTRKMLAESNSQLENANGQLETANNQLAAANGLLTKEKAKLAEAYSLLENKNTKLLEQNNELSSMDRIKEVYIVEFLKRSRTYLIGLDDYRKALLKVAKNSKIDDLVRRLRDDEPIKKEENRFYHDFDTAFLGLHPDFVSHFNAMFAPEDCFVPRRDELLNTELRIFALIRMGVTDTAKIAEFLNCSMPTIYNYRSRIKNKSLLDKDEFEKRLMEC